MTRRNASFLAAIIILVIFIGLSVAKQDITYFWPGLLPIFILVVFGLIVKD